MGIVGTKVSKQFGDPPIEVLHALSFEIDDGEFVSVSGRSGSGKSTLMYILSTLDKPSSGSIAIDGRDVASWNSRELHHFRNTQVGFIFQFHYLLPELTALENILLAPMNLGLAKQKTSQAMELMDLVGVSDQARKLPGQMSGGQQQRVAIARALIMNPRYIFADEPTGNLDTHNSEIIMKVLLDTRDRHKTTVILVTHDPDYARLADREIYLVDGHIAPTK